MAEGSDDLESVPAEAKPLDGTGIGRTAVTLVGRWRWAIAAAGVIVLVSAAWVATRRPRLPDEPQTVRAPHEPSRRRAPSRAVARREPGRLHLGRSRPGQLRRLREGHRERGHGPRDAGSRAGLPPGLEPGREAPRVPESAGDGGGGLRGVGRRPGATAGGYRRANHVPGCVVVVGPLVAGRTFSRRRRPCVRWSELGHRPRLGRNGREANANREHGGRSVPTTSRRSRRTGGDSRSFAGGRSGRGGGTCSCNPCREERRPKRRATPSS